MLRYLARYLLRPREHFFPSPLFFFFDYRINWKGRENRKTGEIFLINGSSDRSSKITFQLVNHYLSLRTTIHTRVSITRLREKRKKTSFAQIFIFKTAIPSFKGNNDGSHRYLARRIIRKAGTGRDTSLRNTCAALNFDDEFSF